MTNYIISHGCVVLLIHYYEYTENWTVTFISHGCVVPLIHYYEYAENWTVTLVKMQQVMFGSRTRFALLQTCWKSLVTVCSVGAYNPQSISALQLELHR